jgi:hypothetical protein
MPAHCAGWLDRMENRKGLAAFAMFCENLPDRESGETKE